MQLRYIDLPIIFRHLRIYHTHNYYLFKNLDLLYIYIYIVFIIIIHFIYYYCFFFSSASYNSIIFNSNSLITSYEAIIIIIITQSDLQDANLKYKIIIIYYLFDDKST